MKKLTLIVGLAIAALYVGCDQISDLDEPTVTATAIESGAKLRLAWTAVTDAEGYKVKVDDSTYTVAKTIYSYDVTGPAKLIKVWAYNGSITSPEWELDCAAVVTTSITVYGKSDADPNHPSGFGFNTDGQGVAYSLTNQAASVDFVIDDVFSAGDIQFASPVACTPPVNDWGNASQDALADFDAITLAPGTGNYQTRQNVLEGGTYACWLDHNDDGAIDVTDHFAKVKEISANGAQLTLKLAYQKVGGLRWLKN